MKTSTPILITVEEMAQMLGIKRTTAWKLIHTRTIKSLKIGGARRVPIVEIEAYVQKQLEAA